MYKTFFSSNNKRHRFNNILDLWFSFLGTIKANSIYIFQINISNLLRLISLRINRFLTSLSQRRKKKIDGCTMMRVDIPDLRAHVPGVWKTLDATVLSTIRNLFPEWNLSGWNLFTVRSFFSSSSSSFSSRFRPSSHPLLQTRLDEDRPAFINHPLKRNPWRSIINDLATTSKRSHAQTKPGPLNVSSTLRYVPDWRETEDQILLPRSFLSVTNASSWYIYACTLISQILI